MYSAGFFVVLEFIFSTCLSYAGLLDKVRFQRFYLDFIILLRFYLSVHHNFTSTCIDRSHPHIFVVIRSVLSAANLSALQTVRAFLPGATASQFFAKLSDIHPVGSFDRSAMSFDLEAFLHPSIHLEAR